MIRLGFFTPITTNGISARGSNPTPQMVEGDSGGSWAGVWVGWVGMTGVLVGRPGNTGVEVGMVLPGMGVG